MNVSFGGRQTEPLTIIALEYGEMFSSVRQPVMLVIAVLIQATGIVASISPNGKYAYRDYER